MTDFDHSMTAPQAPPEKIMPRRRKPAALPADPAVETRQTLVESSAPAALSVWQPMPEQVETVRVLAELNWPAQQIAEEMEIPVIAFMASSQMVAAFNAGHSVAKLLPQKRASWRPKLTDIENVLRYAKKGQNERMVAARMCVPYDVFMARMADTVQLRDAFSQGNGEFFAKKWDEFVSMTNDKDSSLKYMTTPSIYISKLAGMRDGGEKEQQRPIQVEHTHRLEMPKPVKIDEIADFAKQEMERAAAARITVDAEIVDPEVSGS